MSQFGRVLVLMSALLLAAPVWCAPADASELQSVEIITARGVQVLAVELAATKVEITRGLKGRTELPEGSGMLFDFTLEMQATMSMKDTAIALDMIFIRADGRISHIVENLTPMVDRQIHSGGPVRGVLEVPAGTVRRLGIAPGDRVGHRIFSARR